MTISNWLTFFKQHYEIKIFHINHLKLLTSLKDHTLRVSLSRLTKKNSIKRICRGFYANPFNPPAIEEISGQIYRPSYISLESALSFYGLLSQIPQVLSCVTTQLPRTFKTNFGTIEYRQIKRPYFYGFQEKNKYFLAEKEKAFADYLYLSTKKSRRYKLSTLHLEDINWKRAKRHALKMNLSDVIPLLEKMA